MESGDKPYDDRPVQPMKSIPAQIAKVRERLEESLKASEALAARLESIMNNPAPSSLEIRNPRMPDAQISMNAASVRSQLAQQLEEIADSVTRLTQRTASIITRLEV